jgi:hypothetical protein
MRWSIASWAALREGGAAAPGSSVRWAPTAAWSVVNSAHLHLGGGAPPRIARLHAGRAQAPAGSM